MIYTMLFLIGAIGLVAMALMGLGHGGGHHAGHMSHGSDSGHAHAGAHSHGSHSHTQTAHDNAAHDQAPADWRSQAGSLFWTLLSPLTLFSLLLGAGATGMLLLHRGIASAIVATAAAAGALACYGLITRPLMGFLFKFASLPSEALEGAAASTAEALTHFDTSGKGMVRLVVDGQIIRILARLENDDAVHAAEVRPGDKLIVTTVDPHRNTCRVARL